MDLLFGRGSFSGSHVDLLFGDTSDNTLPVVDGRLAGDLTSLAFASIIGGLSEGTLVVSLSAFSFSASGTYISNTPRPTVGSTVSGWQDAAHLGARVAEVEREALAASARVSVHGERGTPVAASFIGRLENAVPLRRQVVSALQDAAPARAAWTLSDQEALRSERASIVGRWGEALDVRTAWTLSDQDALRDRRRWAATGFQDATRLRASGYTGAWTDAVQLLYGLASRFQDARRPPYGVTVPELPPEEVACYDPALPLGLLFYEPRPLRNATAFLFRCFGWAPTPAGIVIPVRSAYIVENQVALRRVDNNLQLKATSISLSLDVDSWTWTFRASGIPASQWDAVAGKPVLEATINGHSVRVLAESRERQRTFAETTVTLSGRGISAALGDPFAAIKLFDSTVARTAEQLANHVLTEAGVPLGWDVDWQMADWLVPADIWTLQGRYMDALNAIAGAAGGYVQPHPTAQTLRFLPRYPVLPWDWSEAEPDIQLPSSAVTVEGVSDRSKPEYNRVFVAGMEGGVLVDATRAGTAGDREAPQVTDMLATHLTAGAGRAAAILADTGDQADVRLKTPVFPELGLILPGNLIRYVDGATTRYGLSRAIQVEATPTDTWQTIEVETHA
jgi:hypothetical protein